MRDDARLRAAGLKKTTARTQILEFLRDQAQPRTQAQVHAALPELDRVTTYRTLAALEEAGITHAIHGLDGVWRWCAHAEDAARCPGGHAHWMCRTCGEMRCLLDISLPWVAVPEDLLVKGKQFLLFGECERCRAGHE